MMPKTSKYLKLKEKVLLAAEESGLNRLPSERELAAKYKVSRNTAKKAMNSLLKDKLVSRRVGNGTFIIPSKRKVRISLVLTGVGENLVQYFKEEALIYSSLNSSTEISIRTAPANLLIKTAKEMPGAKILVTPAVGYLVKLGLLARLDNMSNFTESLRKINSKYLDWISLQKDKSACYSIPYALSSYICAVNRQHAETLGLDFRNGPEDISDLFDWLQKARNYNKYHKGNIIGGTHICGIDARFSRPLPRSFYLTFSGGKPFLREENGQPVFDFSSGKEWLEFFHKIKVTGSIYEQKTPHPHPVITGNTLFSYEIGPWILKELDKAGLRSSVNFVQFPGLDKMDVSFSHCSKSSMAIMEDGLPDHPDRKAAWDFLRHITCDDEPQRRLAENYSFLSPNNVVFSEQTKDASLNPFIQALVTGVMREDCSAQHSVMKIVGKYFFDAIHGLRSVEDAVARIEEMCNLQIEIEKERI